MLLFNRDQHVGEFIAARDPALVGLTSLRARGLRGGMSCRSRGVTMGGCDMSGRCQNRRYQCNPQNSSDHKSSSKILFCNRITAVFTEYFGVGAAHVVGV